MQMFSFVSFVSPAKIHATHPECHCIYIAVADQPEIEIALITLCFIFLPVI